MWMSNFYGRSLTVIRILRLRNELQKVMNAQAGRLPDRAKSNAYLSTQYETMLSGISVRWVLRKAGLSNHLL